MFLLPHHKYIYYISSRKTECKVNTSQQQIFEPWTVFYTDLLQLCDRRWKWNCMSHYNYLHIVNLNSFIVTPHNYFRYNKHKEFLFIMKYCTCTFKFLHFTFLSLLQTWEQEEVCRWSRSLYKGNKPVSVCLVWQHLVQVKVQATVPVRVRIMWIRQHQLTIKTKIYTDGVKSILFDRIFTGYYLHH